MPSKLGYPAASAANAVVQQTVRVSLYPSFVYKIACVPFRSIVFLALSRETASSLVHLGIVAPEIPMGAISRDMISAGKRNGIFDRAGLINGSAGKKRYADCLFFHSGGDEWPSIYFLGYRMVR